jgi:ATP-dependent Clp protease, protease subunit
VTATQRPTGQRPQKTIYVSFSAEINTNTTESLISTMAECVRQRANEVRLLFSSGGGNVMHGINIYNILRGLPFRLVTHNVGNVDSISNAIFLGGEDRYACPHSTFMFHGVSYPFTGDVNLGAKQLRETLASVEADEARIGSIIQERSKLSETQTRTFFGDAHTMGATEALSVGIIHEIRDVQIPPGSTVITLMFQR